ncbi:PAS domain S-box protein [Methylorubrum sp. GM97]|uniref:PAS domain S-box protein n=1 Tax=Methylorubrum sp. GM97 TaxID=2938232 RepID=UPI002189A6E0|nr:PAS domain S-box protein [Methylorubrum sp. GM97]BDL41787.1 hypothetical protein MSPGM_43770 [Methylorubrum sp. GM97]
MTAIDTITTEAEAPDRLAVLDSYGILDTPPEQGFDDIVHLARELCDAPVALVSLVAGKRQWFKARAGFPRCETDLDASVCAHALVAPDLLVIPDLTRDPRTLANPLVTDDPHLRFYAGAPLRSPEGAVLGSLCVIDHKPRPDGLTDRQAMSLRALAGQVMAQLELRRLNEAQRKVLNQREVLIRTQATVAEAKGDLDVILDALLAGAMEVMPHAEGAVIETRDGDELVYRAVRGSLAGHAGLRLPVSGSLSGSCVAEGRSALVRDVLADPRVRRDLVGALRLRSCVVVPVRRAGSVVGVLKLQSSRLGAFTEADLRLAQVFAGTILAGLAEAGEAEALREASRTEYRRKAVFDSARDYAIVLMDLEGKVTDWNSGAAEILGWQPEEMCGHPADAFFTPEDRAAGIPAREMQAALEKGRGIDERWHLRRDGERFWANGEMMVLRDGDGAAIGFVKILRDRTEQKQGVARLQESQERYRLAARATNDAVWDWNLVTNHVLWNEALTEAYGHAPEAVEPTGDWWISHIHPDDRARIDASIHAVIDGTSSAWTGEYRFLRADGSYADVLDRGYVLRGEDGRACRMIGAMLDLTEQRRAGRALRASETSLRAVLDTVPVGILFAEAPSGRIVGGNRRIEELLRHPILPSPDSESYRDWVAFHADGRQVEPSEYPLTRIIRDGVEHAKLECEYRRGDGTLTWVEIVGAPMRDETGRRTGAVVTLADIAERKRAEAHQDLLNRELSHRMKNLLAMVQAIATSTLRGATDIDAAREVLGSRLVALGKAHDVLLGGAAESASLTAVVRQGVGVHEAAGRRVVFEGPDIEIGGKAALSLALALHELTTNAVKYGALSVPEGEVAVTASLVRTETEPCLRIAWTEHGGPPVLRPSRKGFGSRLIERGLTAQVGAELVLDYPPGGVTCVVEAPLANFQAVD